MTEALMALPFENKTWDGNVIEDGEWVSDCFDLLNRKSIVPTFTDTKFLSRKNKKSWKVAQERAKELFEAVVKESKFILKMCNIVTGRNTTALIMSMDSPEQFSMYVNALRLRMMLEMLEFDAMMGSGPRAPILLMKKDVPVGMIMPIFIEEEAKSE